MHQLRLPFWEKKYLISKNSNFHSKRLVCQTSKVVGHFNMVFFFYLIMIMTIFSKQNKIFKNDKHLGNTRVEQIKILLFTSISY